MPYQERIVEHIKAKRRCAVFAEMGLGKTVSTLTALADMLDSGDLRGSTLIIAPLRVAEHVWVQEMLSWSHFRAEGPHGRHDWEFKLKMMVGTGSAERRKSVFHRNVNRTGDVFLINRENVPWLLNEFHWDFNNVIIDESQSFKSQKAKRFRALKREIADAERVILLTGTPISTGYQDLWTQMYLLDLGARLGRTNHAFLSRWFTYSTDGPWAKWGKWEINKGASEQIEKRISDLCLSLKTEDWLEMPEIVYNTVHAHLNDKEIKQYRRFKRERYMELRNEPITAVNAAVAAGKLLQLANGAVYSEYPKWEVFHDRKMQVLEEILEGVSGNAIIAYGYRSDMSRITGMLKKAGKTYSVVGEKGAEHAVDEWNAGEMDCLVLHPASAGHGLNLQHGGSNLIWFSLPWSLELYSQTNARIAGGHRAAGRKPVIHQIVAKDTYDELVVDVLNDREGDRKKLMQSLKDHVAED